MSGEAFPGFPMTKEGSAISGQLAAATRLLTQTIGDQAAQWDHEGRLPEAVLRCLSGRGVLCAQVPGEFGGLGLSGQQGGELTAHAGSLCSSVRSVMTAQGMAAWIIQRSGNQGQRERFLAKLTGGDLAAVAFSEQAAGSDLGAMQATVRQDGDMVVISGHKTWVTGAAYADLIIVFARCRDGAAVVLVPATAPGVSLEPVTDSLGCRAAGHAHVQLEDVRLPPAQLLGGAGQPLVLQLAAALTYGRISVAWGCTGILRACLAAVVRHARSREQFGKPLAQHQLVARHLAELLAGEQTATRVSEHASRCWDERSPDMVLAAIVAKHVAAGLAARGAASAVQVLGSAGARDSHVVARAYRDAKVMEIIEGSTEICQLLLAEQALATQP